MLSPKARNDVVASRGGVSTVTMNEQLSRRCSASGAVQVTVAWPIVNGDPPAGEQLVVTGSGRLRTDGAVNGTGVAAPSSDWAVCAAGQVILGGSAVTGT